MPNRLSRQRECSSAGRLRPIDDGTAAAAAQIRHEEAHAEHLSDEADKAAGPQASANTTPCLDRVEDNWLEVRAKRRADTREAERAREEDERGDEDSAGEADRGGQELDLENLRGTTNVNRRSSAPVWCSACQAASIQWPHKMRAATDVLAV